MAVATTGNLSYVLDEVVSALAFEAFYEEPFMMPVLFGVRGSSRRRERAASLAGLTLWTEKQHTQAPDEDQIIQQFEKTFTHKTYGKQLPVERELIEDEEFDLMMDIASQIGITASQTMEQHAADLWNDMFDGATYTAEDGLAICHTAHLNAAGGNSQGNKKTAALSFSNLEAARLAHRKITNYRGDKISIRPRLLVLPIDLEQTGWEIVKSIGKPGVDENTLNFYNGMFDMIAWDFLDDTNDWFLVDPRLMKQNLLWYQRVPMETFGEGNLFTGTRKIGGYMRYSLGVRDWRFVMGSEVS